MIKIEINKTLSNLFFIDLEIINQMILLILLLLQSYFKDNWNTFDFVTVVGSIVDALMVEFAVSIDIFILKFWTNGKDTFPRQHRICVPRQTFLGPSNVLHKCKKIT